MLNDRNHVLIHCCHNVSRKCVLTVYYFDKKQGRKTVFKSGIKTFQESQKHFQRSQLIPHKLSVVYCMKSLTKYVNCKERGLSSKYIGWKCYRN